MEASTARRQPPLVERTTRRATPRLALPDPPVGVRLVVLSCLVLFVELALIRLAVSNNVYLAELKTFVLLASFLGIGIGFMRGKAGPELLPWAPVALAATIGFLFAFPVRLVDLDRHQLSGAFGMHALPRPLSMAAVFVLTASVMACLGHGTARAFGEFRSLDAYRLDILGSLAGIVVFSVLAFVESPPLAWGAVASAGLVVVLGSRLRAWHVAALVALLALLAGQWLHPYHSHTSAPHWSPYYKVVDARVGRGSYAVLVNNRPHQTIYPIAELRHNQPFYWYPYRHVRHGSLRHVLIVGAGTGNDVAVALSQGARHVDAVEIDPQLARIGRAKHPDHPYQSPRVSLHINDGRAYLQQSGKRYDLILFALPDSLTVLGGESNLRLENYLFTVEAMRTARAHLEPSGTFSMYNYYEPFVLARYATTLRRVYGHVPCADLGSKFGQRSQAVLSVSRGGPARGCATPYRGPRASVATDDWPYAYLRVRSIPDRYLIMLAAVIAGSLIAVRAAGGPFRSMGRYVDLAFMGGAFLLLETKSVVQFTLLFGTTWFVNSLVFAGVLVSVLVAVEVARHAKLPRAAVLYAGLFLAVLAAWAIPPSALLDLSPAARFLAAASLAFAPIFMANLVFAQRFKEVSSSTTAFAANLLGAMIGGALEYVALATGYRFLLVIVALMYGLAWLSSRLLGRRGRAAIP